MANINENELLDEIRYDIKVKDLLKARIVLSSLEHVSRNVQKQALFELSRADDDFAIPLLAGIIAKSQDVSESFPQLKETMFSKILDSPEVLLDLLSKEEDPVSRAFLAEVAGEIRLEKAAPILLRMLTKEEDLKIIKPAIISLGMIGDLSAVTAISEYMYVGNRDVVIASVHALGELATPEALQKLVDRLGGDTDLDLMILNIIAKVQIPEALEKLNEVLGSQFAHLRTAAKQKLSEIGVMSIRILTKNLLRDDPDLVIHSLNVLGDVGDGAAVPAIRKLLHSEPKDPNVRFAAYETLGRLPLDKGAYALAAGLEDPVDNVRNAAARAIDRNYNPVLAAGIRNLTRSGEAEAQKIMMIIINSQCDKVLLDLFEENFFKGPAVEYLAGKAHPDIRSHYARVFADAGYNDLAKQIAPKGMAKVSGKRKVFAVDDSRMILNIYRTMLHNLDYETQLFEFPAGALERIQQEKPDIILTDLNMPDITGIELTKGVRQQYNKEELPIIMVTTQDEARDKEAAYDAGVNGILQKPFTEEQIGKALKKYAGSPAV